MARRKNTRRKATPTNGANLGFEDKLWAAADKLRGKRVRIYSDPLLRNQIKSRFPDALEWPPVGLPEDYLPLLARGRSAFVRESERLVGHGGISLEELVVPLVHIERRDT